MRQDDKQVSRGASKHTNRGTRWNNALLVPPGGRGCTLTPCKAFLEELLHPALVDPGEREDVHPQVGALGGPWHLLECDVGIGVLLQAEAKGYTQRSYTALPSVSSSPTAVLCICQTWKMLLTNTMFHAHVILDLLSVIFPTLLKAFFKITFVNMQNSRRKQKKITA